MLIVFHYYKMIIFKKIKAKKIIQGVINYATKYTLQQST